MINVYFNIASYSIGTDHFSPNELLKPLFYLFAGVPGGGTFRREMQNALIKENKPLREAVLAGLKYLPNEIIYEKDEGDLSKIHSYEAPHEDS